MLESLQAVMLNYGYFGLFLASFLASTIVPFGSEGILVFLVYEKFNIPALVLIASAGNYLGACTSYYIGLKGRSFAEKYLSIDPKNLEKAEKYFSKHGTGVLLFTWLPVIGDAFTVFGGLLKVKFWIFSVLVFTGKLLRYLAVAYFAAAVL
ncbi:SNARE associated Golgi protein [uncultured archaeon]|nr:SNARE associated Golgi protein [uncultured archaeon]